MTKFKLLLIFLMIALWGCATLSPQPSLKQETSFGKWQTAPLEKNEGVILIPQWHLSPQINTKTNKAELPQFKNQMAIYKTVSAWIQSHDISSVLVEGCEGSLSERPDTPYNAWSLRDLDQEKQSQKSIAGIQTHVGLKLQVDFKDQVQILCGDEIKLVQENQLALSDIRGLAGFKLRIKQAGLEQKMRQAFVSEARKILKLSSSQSEAQVIATIDAEIEKSIQHFEKVIAKRNTAFVSKAKALPGKRVIIIGALHIEDLKRQLREQNIPSSVWRPEGLEDGENQLIEQLKNKIRRPSSQLNGVEIFDDKDIEAASHKCSAFQNPT